MMYQDLDLSFRLDSKGDFSVLADANAVKASLYNNLLISNPELYFRDGKRVIVSDFLFEEDDFLTRDNIKSTIQLAIDNDDRIAGTDNIIITFNSDENRYEVQITFTLKTNKVRDTDNAKQVDITLFLNRQ